jgi:DNA-binding GntR family transcriptional regulator
MADTAMSFAPARPRYALLAERLMQDIANEVYPVGAQLPTEAELCNQYNVSRHTVREAIRRIQELGLVASRQGVGTRVIASTPTRQYSQSIGSVDELLQYAFHTRITDIGLEDIEASEDQASEFGCKPGQKFLKISGLRQTVADPDSPPIAWTEIYVNGAFSGIRDSVSEHVGAISDLVYQRYGYRAEEIRQDIAACALRKAEADRLEAPRGSPALRIRRWYYAPDGEMLEYSVSLHPAGRFSFVTRMRREPGA